MYILPVIYNLSNSKTDIEVIVVFYVIDTALIPFLENLQECRRKLVLVLRAGIHFIPAQSLGCSRIPGRPEPLAS